MVDERLRNYIQQQLQTGYSADAISQFLIQNGYSPAVVADAFQQLQQPNEEMLIQYAQKYLQAGYTPVQIEEFLVQHYPLDVVQSSLSKAMEPAQKKIFLPQFLSQKTLLILFLSLLILAVLAGTLWFFANTTVEESPSIYFSITVNPPTVLPGQILYITNSYTTLSEERKYPITIYYTLFEKETSSRIDSWQIAMDREDSLIKNTKYTVLMTTASGNYELHAKMNYGTFSEESSAYFSVVEDESQISEENVVEISVGTETEEREPEEIVEVVSTSSSSTSSSISSGEDDYKNKATAATLAPADPISAAAYCELIVSLTIKDECYWSVAKNSADKSYCEAIVADHTRDACWIGFAFDQHDYTVCREIVNPFIQQSCEQLEKVEELKAEYESEY